MPQNQKKNSSYKSNSGKVEDSAKVVKSTASPTPTPNPNPNYKPPAFRKPK